MYIGRAFSPAEEVESETYGIDFVNDLNLGDGEILSSIVTGQWQVTVTEGTDSDAATRLIGAATIVIPDGGTTATASVQRIAGLQPDVTYAFQVVAVTSLGNTKSLWTTVSGDLPGVPAPLAPSASGLASPGSTISWVASAGGSLFAMRADAAPALDPDVLEDPLAVVTATGSTTERALTDRFGDLTNVINFGAIGDGVTNDDSAFTAAGAAGRTVWVPWTSTGYAFSGAVVNTDRGFLPEPTLTWTKITDAGNFDWSRGFQTTPGAFNDGSAIWRFSDRVFVGGAASQFAGDSLAADSGNSWLSNSSNGPSYLPINGQFVVITNTGKYGIVSASRVSDNVGGGTQAIGVGSAVVNDVASGNAWGYIAELQHETGANVTLGMEIGGKNKSSTDSTKTPYTTAGGVFGLWIVGGGDSSFGGSAANPSNAAIAVLKNAQTWNTGIVFTSDALTGTDGSAGSSTNAVALRMGRRQIIQWDEPTNSSLGASVLSTVTAAAGRVQFVFSDNTFTFIGVNSKNAFVVSHGASAVNYLSALSVAASGSPQLRANGDDTNVGITLVPKGATGQIQLRSADNTSKFAINDTGVGFFATAPIAKQTISGSRADPQAALANLLTALASYGLITNSTTA